ncbi:DUF3048 domain-containing protein [Aquibacillus halophilus]|uniref:DUF3048 domain-containing protein n=1 Tax=Aquibacillus halophilus TaxID=930132 RepID=A0A6A8DG01_9BACI|nr:DUF3048 domain-containing protein [Aquibacillus halophilus]MRH44564.1 DUF3048 domain-containing protein [Aquibacillus halophilus]
MRNYYWKSLILIFLIMTVIVACSKEEQVAEPNPNNEVEDPEPIEEPEEPEPEEPAFKNMYPFSGEPTNDEVNDRAVAVMVNNHPQARPQTGLNKADIVFEILAEGNITRLMAIFQSEKPDVVGPVRSARPYYFNIADDYGAIYVHHGAAGFILDMLKAGAADHLEGMFYDNDRHLFKREDFRVAPHNSYLIFDAVYEVAQGKGYEVEEDHKAIPFLNEEEIMAISGEVANEISFNYEATPVRYTYDTESEKYFRFNGEEQTTDLETGEPIQLDNVFFVETYHEVVDSAGRREIDFSSGGNAYLFQKGKVQSLEWQNIDGQIIPVQNGEPVGFVPGKTWINVIPTSTGLEGASIQ